MNWKTPRFFLSVLVYKIALLSFFISLIAITIFSIWIILPNTIRMVDEKVDLIFEPTFLKDYKKAKFFFEQKQYDEAIVIYRNLFILSKKIGKYDLNRKRKRHIIKNLIVCALNLDNINEAKNVVEYWKKYDSKDIEAKLWEIKLLTLSGEDKQTIISMYDKLILMYHNVEIVTKEYIEFLVQINDIDRAYKIQNAFYKNSKIYYENDLGFKIYFQDNTKFFSEENTLIQRGFPANKKNFELNFEHNFKSIDAIRLDIEEIKARFHNIKYKLSDLHFSIFHEGKEIIVNEIQELNSVLQKSDGSLVVDVNDPFIIFNLPKVISAKSGLCVLKFTFKFEVIQKNYIKTLRE